MDDGSRVDEEAALAKALDDKKWDPSIKALVQFPDVLKTMSDKLDWTQNLGDAFLAQQDEVMDEIQLLRRKADEAGNLESNDKQKVTKDTGGGGGGGETVYVIEQAAPDAAVKNALTSIKAEVAALLKELDTKNLKPQDLFDKIVPPALKLENAVKAV